MKITMRSTSTSASAFYANLSSGKPRAKTVLAIIEALERLPEPAISLHALTSHFNLVLLAESDDRSPWYVILEPIGSFARVSYLLPRRLAPWRDAYVTGLARTVEEGVQKALLAIEHSEGWFGSSPVHW